MPAGEYRPIRGGWEERWPATVRVRTRRTQPATAVMALRWVLLVAAAAAGADAQVPPPAAGPVEVEVDDFFVVGDEATGMDCTARVETIGCFTDMKYTAKIGRDLPYNIPGCFSGDPPSYSKPVRFHAETMILCRKLLDFVLKLMDFTGTQPAGVHPDADDQRVLRQALPRLVAPHPRGRGRPLRLNSSRLRPCVFNTEMKIL